MANVTSSITGNVPAGTHVATFLINGHQGAVQLALSYDINASVSLVLSPIEILIPDLSATVWYKLPASIASSATLSGYTLTMNADGNYFVTIEDIPLNATKLRVTATYGDDVDGTLNINCYTDVD